ncbi:hypothetical protein LZ30DRAFT_634950 [Colletotrichum cereale]|nr:hypothetical protein LZ30DRAFT_634950 [Colletotrichum cereale]
MILPLSTIVAPQLDAAQRSLIKPLLSQGLENHFVASDACLVLYTHRSEDASVEARL